MWSEFMHWTRHVKFTSVFKCGFAHIVFKIKFLSYILKTFWPGLWAIVWKPAGLDRQPQSQWVFLTPDPWRTARAMRSRGEQRVSSRGGERREGMRRAGSGTSFLLSNASWAWAAKPAVQWKGGKERQAGCGVPLGGVIIYNKGEAARLKKDPFKNSAEA